MRYSIVGFASCVVLSACASTQPGELCGPNAAPLNDFTIEATNKGTASAKTPDGGISLDVVNEKKIPIQLTAELSAELKNKTQGICIPNNLDPKAWVIVYDKSGTFKIETRGE